MPTEPEQLDRTRLRSVALIVGVLVALGAVVAAGTWYGDDSTPAADSSSVEVSVGSGSVFVGDAAAPVQIVIYEDFLSSLCRQLEESTRDFLRENAAQGKVRIEYRPIHQLTESGYSGRALNAWAAVLQHASPQAALKLHDLLFERQPDEQGSEEMTADQIADLVQEAGADSPEVAAALMARDRAFFAAADEEMAAEGITETPTVMVDGTTLTGSSVPELRAQMERAVAKAP